MNPQTTTLNMEQKFKKTPAGEIPVDWEACELGVVASQFLNGGTPDTQVPAYWQGSLPWITGADFVHQRVGLIRRYINQEAVKNSATNVVPKGSVLVVTRTGVGKVAVAPFDIAISQDITAIIPDGERADGEFLYRVLDFNSGRLQAIHQGTSINGILREDLEGLFIPLPPLTEQEKIVEILSAVDDAIQKTYAVIEKTKQLKKGLMQHLLTRGIERKRLKETEVGKIPEDWKVVRLGESVSGEFKNGINKGRNDFGFGTLFVNIQDAYESETVQTNFLGRLNASPEETKVYALTPGDLVMVRSSVKPGGVGYPILFRGSDEPVLFCGFTLRYRPNLQTWDQKFLYYSLVSDRVRNRVISMASISANTNISQESYGRVPLACPSIDEQKLIADRIECLSRQLAAENPVRQYYSELKKALMQVLLTGKVRVNIADRASGLGSQ